MPETDPLAPSLDGALWVLWNYLRLAPLIPLLVLTIRWPSLRSRLEFLLFALAVSIGIQFIWDAAVAAAEYFVFGALSAHARGRLWEFLRFSAPFHLVALISFAAVWRLSRYWQRSASEG
jgi:hypothetical protein